MKYLLLLSIYPSIAPVQVRELQAAMADGSKGDSKLRQALPQTILVSSYLHCIAGSIAVQQLTGSCSV